MTWCIFVRRFDCSYMNGQRLAFQWSNYTYLHFCIHKHTNIVENMRAEHVCGALSVESFMTRHDPYCNHSVKLCTDLRAEKMKTRNFELTTSKSGESATFATLTSLQRTYWDPKRRVWMQLYRLHKRKWGKLKRDTEATKAKPITNVCMCCFSSSFHFCLMLMLYTERFYKKALHIFRFHEKKKARQTENRRKLGIIPFLCLFSTHAAFILFLSHTFLICENWKGKRRAEGCQTRNANAHQHIETPCNKWREDLLQDVHFFIYAFILIYLHCREERKLKNT